MRALQEGVNNGVKAAIAVLTVMALALVTLITAPIRPAQAAASQAVIGGTWSRNYVNPTNGLASTFTNGTNNAFCAFNPKSGPVAGPGVTYTLNKTITKSSPGIPWAAPGNVSFSTKGNDFETAAFLINAWGKKGASWDLLSGIDAALYTLSNKPHPASSYGKIARNAKYRDDLISLARKNTGPYTVVAEKPIYHETFKSGSLTRNHVVSANMGIKSQAGYYSTTYNTNIRVKIILTNATFFDGSTTQTRNLSSGKLDTLNYQVIEPGKQVKINYEYINIPTYDKIFYYLPDKNVQPVFIPGTGTDSLSREVFIDISGDPSISTTASYDKDTYKTGDTVNITGGAVNSDLKVVSTLYYGGNSGLKESASIPAGAIKIATDTQTIKLNSSGGGKVTVPEVDLTDLSTGYYTWVTTVSGGNNAAKTSNYGIPGETIFHEKVFNPEAVTAAAIGSQRSDGSFLVTDSVVVSMGKPGADVTVDGTLYYHGTSKPSQSNSIPSSAKKVNATPVSTTVKLDSKGGATVNLPAVTLPPTSSVGFYTWVTSVSGTGMSYTSAYGISSETIQFNKLPEVEIISTTSNPVVKSGKFVVNDKLTIKGTPGIQGLDVRSDLYFHGLTKPVTSPTVPAGKSVVRTDSKILNLDSNGIGTLTTGDIDLTGLQEGYYTWVTTVTGNAITMSVSDYGVDSETFLYVPLTPNVVTAASKGVISPKDVTLSDVITVTKGVPGSTLNVTATAYYSETKPNPGDDVGTRVGSPVTLSLTLDSKGGATDTATVVVGRSLASVKNPGYISWIVSAVGPGMKTYTSEYGIPSETIEWPGTEPGVTTQTSEAALNPTTQQVTVTDTLLVSGGEANKDAQAGFQLYYHGADKPVQSETVPENAASVGSEQLKDFVTEADGTASVVSDPVEINKALTGWYTWVARYADEEIATEAPVLEDFTFAGSADNIYYLDTEGRLYDKTFAVVAERIPVRAEGKSIFGLPNGEIAYYFSSSASNHNGFMVFSTYGSSYYRNAGNGFSFTTLTSSGAGPLIAYSPGGSQMYLYGATFEQGQGTSSVVSGYMVDITQYVAENVPGVSIDLMPNSIKEVRVAGRSVVALVQGSLPGLEGFLLWGSNLTPTFYVPPGYEYHEVDDHKVINIDLFAPLSTSDLSTPGVIFNMTISDIEPGSTATFPLTYGNVVWNTSQGEMTVARLGKTSSESPSVNYLGDCVNSGPIESISSSSADSITLTNNCGVMSTLDGSNPLAIEGSQILERQGDSSSVFADFLPGNESTSTAITLPYGVPSETFYWDGIKGPDVTTSANTPEMSVENSSLTFSDEVVLSGGTPQTKVGVNATLYYAGTTSPAEVANVPSSAVSLGSVSGEVTLDNNGNGSLSMDNISINPFTAETGYYTWVVSTSSPDGDFTNTVTSRYGVPAETVYFEAPVAPEVTTVSKDLNWSGTNATLRDTVLFANGTPGLQYDVVATLYRTENAPVQSATVPSSATQIGTTASTRVTIDDDGNGSIDTAAVAIPSGPLGGANPGYYTWVVEATGVQIPSHKVVSDFGVSTETVHWQGWEPPLVTTSAIVNATETGAIDTVLLSNGAAGQVVNVEAQLYYAGTNKPAQRGTVPSTATKVGSPVAVNATLDADGLAKITTSEVTLPFDSAIDQARVGWYTWVVTTSGVGISESDSDYGIPSETFEITPPEKTEVIVSTQIGSSDNAAVTGVDGVLLLNSGDKVTDNIHVVGNALTKHPARITATLYGPIVSETVPNEINPNNVDKFFETSINADRPGLFTTTESPVITKPGLYVWTYSFDSVSVTDVNGTSYPVYDGRTDLTVYPEESARLLFEFATDTQAGPSGTATLDTEVFDDVVVSGYVPNSEVTIYTTLYGPFETKPVQSSEVPEDAPIIETFENKVRTDKYGKASFRVDVGMLASAGYYVFADSSDGIEGVTKPWRSDFGIPAETISLVSAYTNGSDVLEAENTVKDTAIIDGNIENGSVKFELYKQNNGPVSEDEKVYESSVVSITGPGNVESEAIAIPDKAPGKYYWVATIYEDGNELFKDMPRTGSETFFALEAHSEATAISPSGSPITDTLHIIGSLPTDLNVTFELWKMGSGDVETDTLVEKVVNPDVARENEGLATDDPDFNPYPHLFPIYNEGNMPKGEDVPNMSTVSVTSAEVTVDEAGSYYWISRVVYPDMRPEGAAAGNVPEPIVVYEDNPRMDNETSFVGPNVTTETKEVVSFEDATQEGIFDTATVDGTTLDGSYLIFELFEQGTGNISTDKLVATTEKVAVTGAGDYDSPKVKVDGSGVYYWVETLYMPDPDTPGSDLEIAKGKPRLPNETTYIPEIGTSATGVDGKQLAVGETITVIDTVTYQNLRPGYTYELTGTLHYTDGSPFGDPVSKSFIPTVKDGVETIEFIIDTRDLQGRDLVVFESLAIQPSGYVVGEHKDPEDPEQTVYVPKIGTTATGNDGGKEILVGKSVVIDDVVKYENLIVGDKYTVTGTLHYSDGSEVLVDGKPVVSTSNFRPSAKNGEEIVSFTFDASQLTSVDVVVYEKLFNAKGNVIAIHEDPEDPGQTVNIPKIGTTATGENGEKEFLSSAELTLVDTVKYEGLTSNKEYTVTGILHYSDGSEVLVDGKTVTATSKFTPDTRDGEVKITFVFDSREIAGKDVVAYEKVFDVDGRLVATHEDPNDPEQTVNIPKIGTIATGENGEKEIEPDGSMVLVDKIAYEGLLVGKEYTANGTLHYADGSKVLVDGEPVTASAVFTPETRDGEVEVTFIFDTTKLVSANIVVFEQVVNTEGNVIAIHEDPEDPDQTIKIRGIDFYLEKLGSGDRLSGSRWQLETVDGEILVDGQVVAEEEPEASVFFFENIDVGSYLLRETKAPEGYQLLAEPIEMSINDNGSITVAEPSTVEANGLNGLSLISVNDVPDLRMPNTGEDGDTVFVYAGLALLLLGAAGGVGFLIRYNRNKKA